MFEELQKEPEDVFAQTDAVSPKVASPTAQLSAMPDMPPSPALPEVSGRPFPWKVVVLMVLILGGVILAFFLSMKILQSKTPVTPPAPESTAPTQTTEPVVQTPAPSLPTETSVLPTTPTETQEVPESTLVAEVDTDRDGLSDAREASLGTNPQTPDTDADGLFDKEEVDVYRTNPLNPDTDGDGYNDGDEVKNGYNPNGPGTLMQVPQK